MATFAFFLPSHGRNTVIIRCERGIRENSMVDTCVRKDSLSCCPSHITQDRSIYNIECGQLCKYFKGMSFSVHLCNDDIIKT